jgi:hypothetical protein
MEALGFKGGCGRCQVGQRMKTHYDDPLWVSYCTAFQGCACLSVSHLKILKDFHNIFAYYVRI